LTERVEQWNQQIREEALQKGRQEGSLQARRETALAMLRDGHLDNATIARYTGLHPADIQALRAPPTEH
jgi:predicted transposase YdaD